MPFKSNKRLVAIGGSLAFDCVMNFSGRFSDHIIPGKIHDLNLSFPLSQLNTGFGGTAGNIAYNLALLQERSAVLTAVGADFFSYRQHLNLFKINLRGLAIDRKERCAAAFIMTDEADNQLAGFYPGSSALPNFAKLNPASIAYAIIAPDAKARMLAVQEWAQQKQLPYIFDPGQQVINFSSVELRKMIRSAFLVIGNDYEIEIMRRALAAASPKAINPKQSLIITKGAQGSEIISQGRSILIGAVKTETALDPTGAGDAYRAGLLKGLLAGFNLEQAAKLAATVAVYAVEKKGTQNHYFKLSGLKNRYRRHFGETLILS